MMSHPLHLSRMPQLPPDLLHIGHTDPEPLCQECFGSLSLRIGLQNPAPQVVRIGFRHALVSENSPFSPYHHKVGLHY